MLYLSGAENPGTRRLAARGLPLGVMAQPGNAVHQWADRYPAWAADNGCFARGAHFDVEQYLAWLARLPHRTTCLFATAPDVVGDAAATWARSAPVLPLLRDLGYRAALVAQDGIERGPIAWDAFDVLFVGGTTAWKLGPAYGVVAEAKRRGVWCHQGRCNSWRRLSAARTAGYQSADGTYLKFGPEKNLPKVERWLRQLERQPHMLLLEGLEVQP